MNLEELEAIFRRVWTHSRPPLAPSSFTRSCCPTSIAPSGSETSGGTRDPLLRRAADRPRGGQGCPRRRRRDAPRGRTLVEGASRTRRLTRLQPSSPLHEGVWRVTKRTLRAGVIQRKSAGHGPKEVTSTGAAGLQQRHHPLGGGVQSTAGWGPTRARLPAIRTFTSTGSDDP